MARETQSISSTQIGISTLLVNARLVIGGQTLICPRLYLRSKPQARGLNGRLNYSNFHPSPSGGFSSFCCCSPRSVRRRERKSENGAAKVSIHPTLTAFIDLREHQAYLPSCAIPLRRRKSPHSALRSRNKEKLFHVEKNFPFRFFFSGFPFPFYCFVNWAMLYIFPFSQPRLSCELCAAGKRQLSPFLLLTMHGGKNISSHRRFHKKYFYNEFEAQRVIPSVHWSSSQTIAPRSLSMRDRIITLKYL